MNTIELALVLVLVLPLIWTAVSYGFSKPDEDEER